MSWEESRKSLGLVSKSLLGRRLSPRFISSMNLLRVWDWMRPSPALNSPVPILYTWVKRTALCEISVFPGTKTDVPVQGSNPDRWIRSRVNSRCLPVYLTRSPCFDRVTLGKLLCTPGLRDYLLRHFIWYLNARPALKWLHGSQVFQRLLNLSV